MKDFISNHIIKFDKLLGLTAITIAFVSAFFSVYGIATLFAGAFVLTAIMAASLEIGKLVAVTFLYRYWNKINKLLKTYLSIASVVLMLVTSIGIFGYLSSAYQKSSIEFKSTQDKIAMVESNKGFYTNTIAKSELRIKMLSEMRVVQESRLSEGITNAFLSRNPLQLKELQDQTIALINESNSEIKSEDIKIKENQVKIMEINDQINHMKFDSAGKKDIQTFKFVADQFGTTLDNVAKWFILVIIFVFDPLAIALILAYNVVVYKPENSVISIPTPSKEPVLSPTKQLILDNDTSPIVEPLVNPTVEPVLSPTKQLILDNDTSPIVESPPKPDLSSAIDADMRRMFKL